MEPHSSPQYLQINPYSIVPFDYQPKRYSTSSIKLTNVTAQTIAFKIKTNAPFSYLVKPRVGIVSPEETITVNITMQPIDYDSHRTTLNDKFLIDVCPVGRTFSISFVKSEAFNVLFKNTPANLIQTNRLKVNLVLEQSETHDNSLDTKDSSRCESSPVKDEELCQEKGLEEISTLKILESLDRQMSDNNYLDTSFQSTLEPNEGQTRNDLKLMLKCQSATEIPLKTLQEKVLLFERQVSSKSIEEETTKIKMSNLKKIGEQAHLYPKIREERDKLKEQLDNVKNQSALPKKTQQLSKDIYMKNKGDQHFFYGLIVAMIAILLGMLFKLN